MLGVCKRRSLASSLGVKGDWDGGGGVGGWGWGGGGMIDQLKESLLDVVAVLVLVVVVVLLLLLLLLGCKTPSYLLTYLISSSSP